MERYFGDSDSDLPASPPPRMFSYGVLPGFSKLVSFQEHTSNMNHGFIHDYAKDGGLGEVCLLGSFYHEPLRT